MDPILTDDLAAPDPEDWQRPDPTRATPEALLNEVDDLAAALPLEPHSDAEADEADIVDQWREVLLDDEPDA